MQGTAARNDFALKPHPPGVRLRAAIIREEVT
jgi:hypothetical protein